MRVRRLAQGDSLGREAVLSGYRGVLAAEGKGDIPEHHLLYVAGELDQTLAAAAAEGGGRGGVLLCESDAGGDGNTAANFLGYLWWVLADTTPFGPDSCYGPWESCYIYVHTVFVSPEARRRGVGRALYVELDAVAKDLGVEQICLDVYETNPGSAAFHRSLGFGAMTTVFERWKFLDDDV